MANMDRSVPGYRRAKAVTKKDLQRLREGGKKADKIKQVGDKYHEQEIADAENLLSEKLKKL